MSKHYDVAAIASILGLIKREKIDVVSTHSGRDSSLRAFAGRISPKKPVIVRTRHIATCHHLEDYLPRSAPYGGDHQ